MEQLKQKRTPVRSTFTRIWNQLSELFDSAQVDTLEIETLMAQLEDKGKRLQDLDNEILELMQDNKCSQDEYDKEFESAESYSEKLVRSRIRTKKKIEILEIRSTDKVDYGSESRHISELNHRSYKLPKIELKKFGGDFRDWLGFWNQFKKIDEDSTLDPEEKFQYLIQATIPKSKARDIVESFPATKENYPKAMDHLKQRFGRDETLIEVYVRDLLSLVLNNNLDKISDLPKLYDKLETKLRALESLGVTQEKYAAMLYPLIESCLPTDILRAWQRNRGFTCSEEEKGKSDLSSLMKFLRAEVESEQRINLARTNFKTDHDYKSSFKKDYDFRKDNIYKKNVKESKINTASDLFSANSYNRMPNVSKNKIDNICIFCENKHFSHECLKAKNMNIEQKRELAMKRGYCFSCLRRGHRASMCVGKQTCSICRKPHLDIMCTSPNEMNKVVERVSKESITNEKDNVLSNYVCTSVRLQTLRIQLRGEHGNKTVRALIDTGSQRSYICKRIAEDMNYAVTGEENVVHSLFGGIESAEQHHYRYRIFVSSMDGKYKCNFEALDQDTICGKLPSIPNGPWINELDRYKIKLTDTFPCQEQKDENDSEIHILIGADIAGKLLTGNRRLLNSGPIAIETLLGWTLMGKIEINNLIHESSLTVISLLVKNSSLTELWKLETLGITDPSESLSRRELEEAALEHFRKTINIDDEGRYVVSLPWLEAHPPIADCREIAEKRLSLTLKKLKSNGKLKEYQSVFDDWKKQGIIEEVKPHEERNKAYYLPHRPVFKEHSTTKTRPVFDASAHDRNSPSLNNCLEKGPNLLELIPSVLIRFRMKRIGVTADIRQAFLQISLCEKDREFLRFLWYEDGDKEKGKIYRHCRVPFGVTSSPFLLGATISHHLENVPEHLKQTAETLRNSFYVDNCIICLDKEDQVDKFIQEAKQIMSLAKFDLREWHSNKHGIVKTLLTDEDSYPSSEETEDIDREESVPVLGLIWDTHEDTLRCDISNVSEVNVNSMTKRIFLSLAQKIFDPIGFTCPFTLWPKLKLQECWKLNLSWDDELPEEMKKEIYLWYKQISALDHIRIPRWMFKKDLEEYDEVSLHIFCDASKVAYATCIFIRLKDSTETICQLIQSRSRIAPLKQTTIPRLELLACLIGSRLADVVKKILRLPDIPCFYWTDSSNALWWIKRNEPWGTFVSNRVDEIRSLSNIRDWHHVPGKINPADLPSRGCSAHQLKQLKWWEGPEWLKMTEEFWPRDDVFPNEDQINAERRKTVVSAVNCKTDKGWYCKKFSSYIKTVRTLAWIMRFIENCKGNSEDRIINEITVSEFERAENTLLKLVQQECFQETDNKSIDSLQPFRDKNELLRTRTRLTERDDSENFKCPIILPSKHFVVTLLIRNAHENYSHAGVQALMSILREKYWILRCRHTIRQIVRSCVRCRRFRTTKFEVMQAPLPKPRVQDATAFQTTGIDLAGPLFLRNGEKAWIVLFTCAFFRAVHLEVVTTLSTESFLHSFRRFVARRGRPDIVYSDNGSNFVGANNIFKSINWEKVAEKSTIRRIDWRFIPPSAAWWGGWWERLVRMTKELLRSVLGKACLTYEELNTVLCDAESVINSRPLTYISENVDDLTPLTPMMFLLDNKGSCEEDIDYLDRKKLNKRLKYRRHLREMLKKRFRSEYLGQLKYEKNKRNIRQVEVGQVVLLGSDNLKRIHWPLAKVLNLYPGKDGHRRVALIQTKTGKFVRPVQRLFPLEINDEEKTSLQKRRELITSKNPETLPPPRISRSGRKVKAPDKLNL